MGKTFHRERGKVVRICMVCALCNIEFLGMPAAALFAMAQLCELLMGNKKQISTKAFLYCMLCYIFLSRLIFRVKPPLVA